MTPTVTGTLGNNGRYRSDIGITWSVVDPESAIVSTVGCDPTSVTTDTAGFTQTCTATSAGFGGPGTGSVSVKRDATPPIVACNTNPTFTLGDPSATVGGTVSDAGSGPVATSISGAADTSIAGLRSTTLAGSDRAGNISSQSCAYLVTAPQCLGRTPTIVGTGGNDDLNGDAAIDIIDGGLGDDSIRGGAGADKCTSGEIRMSSCAVLY